MPKIFHLAIPLLLSLAVVSGCDSNDSSSSNNGSNGSSSSSSSRPLPPITPPTAADFGKVQVHFPPNFSYVTETTVELSGTVLEPADVTSLTIDGVTIDPSTLADWKADITLAEGENVISVVANLSDGGTVEVDHTLYREDFNYASNVRDFLIDSRDGQYWLLDNVQDAVLKVDPDTFTISRHSPPAGAQENLIAIPTSVVLDIDNNRLIITQHDEVSLLAIDLTSGEQTAITTTDDDNVNWFNRPTAAVKAGQSLYVSDFETVNYDSDGNRLPIDADEDNIASKTERALIYQLDLQTYTRTPILQNDSRSESLISDVSAMSYDVDSDQLYFADFNSSGNGRINRLDINSGELTRLQAYSLSISGESFVRQPYSPGRVGDLQIDPANERLLLVSNNTFLYLNLTEETEINDPAENTEYYLIFTLSSNNVPEDETPLLFKVTNFVYNSTEEVAVYYDEGFNSWNEVDMESGERTALEDEQANKFIDVTDLAFSYDYFSLFISDQSLGAIFEWDSTTGVKSKLISRDDYPDTESQNVPVSVPQFSVATGDNQLIVFDSPPGATGLRPKITSIEFQDDGTFTTRILGYYGASFIDATYNDKNHTVYPVVATNSYYVGEMPLLTDGGTSGLELLSFNSKSPGAPFRQPRGITLDTNAERLLVTDSGVKRLIDVDIENGDRVYLSGFNENDSEDEVQFAQPNAIAMDPVSNRSFILDMANKAILAVNLDDGSKEVWLNIENKPEIGIVNPTDLTIHPFFGYLLVYDQQSKNVIAIDIETQNTARVTW